MCGRCQVASRFYQHQGKCYVFFLSLLEEKCAPGDWRDPRLWSIGYLLQGNAKGWDHHMNTVIATTAIRGEDTWIQRYVERRSLRSDAPVTSASSGVHTWDGPCQPWAGPRHSPTEECSKRHHGRRQPEADYPETPRHRGITRGACSAIPRRPRRARSADGPAGDELAPA